MHTVLDVARSSVKLLIENVFFITLLNLVLSCCKCVLLMIKQTSSFISDLGNFIYFKVIILKMFIKSNYVFDLWSAFFHQQPFLYWIDLPTHEGFT